MIVAAPAPQPARVFTWGQPSLALEVAGRPLGSTLHVFRAGKRVTIPNFHSFPLALVARTMHVGKVIARDPRQVLGVARVSLGISTATVRDNVFTLSRRMKPTALVPKLRGTLVITYRDGRPPARVAIR